MIPEHWERLAQGAGSTGWALAGPTVAFGEAQLLASVQVLTVLVLGGGKAGRGESTSAFMGQKGS